MPQVHCCHHLRQRRDADTFGNEVMGGVEDDSDSATKIRSAALAKRRKLRHDQYVRVVEVGAVVV